MQRKWIIGLTVLGVISVVLMVALASVGTQLDQARLDRDDLELELEDVSAETESLRGERDVIKHERDSLKTQVDEQLQAIEQLKGELERASQSPPASAPPGP
jgi:peptidoglycan hydrolase CwlO-like protein